MFSAQRKLIYLTISFLLITVLLSQNNVIGNKTFKKGINTPTLLSDELVSLSSYISPNGKYIVYIQKNLEVCLYDIDNKSKSILFYQEDKKPQFFSGQYNYISNDFVCWLTVSTKSKSQLREIFSANLATKEINKISVTQAYIDSFSLCGNYAAWCQRQAKDKSQPGIYYADLMNPGKSPEIIASFNMKLPHYQIVKCMSFLYDKNTYITYPIYDNNKSIIYCYNTTDKTSCIVSESEFVKTHPVGFSTGKIYYYEHKEIGIPDLTKPRNINNRNLMIYDISSKEIKTLFSENNNQSIKVVVTTKNIQSASFNIFDSETGKWYGSR